MPEVKFEWDRFLLFSVKLQYQIIETTFLDTETFLETTQSILEEADYTTKIVTANKISFEGYRNRNNFSRITNGTFEIIPGNLNEIIFTYRESITILIISFPTFLILSFMASFGFLIYPLVIGIQDVILLNRLRKTAEHMISIVADPT